MTKDEVRIELNTDFSTKGLSLQEIQGIVAVWETGAIGHETMLELFRRGDVLPEGRANEGELKLLAAPAVSTCAAAVDEEAKLVKCGIGHYQPTRFGFAFDGCFLPESPLNYTPWCQRPQDQGGLCIWRSRCSGHAQRRQHPGSHRSGLDSSEGLA